MSSWCRTCGAEIIWAEGPSGRQMPVDTAPSDRGNVQLYRRKDGSIYARVLEASAAENVRTAASILNSRHTLRVSHFATCPDAAQHRRKETA